MAIGPTIDYRAFATPPHGLLGGWRKLFADTLALVIPRGNPDLESEFGRVTRWWFEVKGGQVVREIGFDGVGSPIVAALWRANLGIFVDQDGLPTGTEDGPEAAQFAATFDEVIQRLESRR